MKKLYLMKIFFTLSLTMMFSLIIFGQKKIVIVSGGTRAEKSSDVIMADSLASWGYDTTYLTSGVFNELPAAEVKQFDGAFFGESIGSNSCPNFGPLRDNFPIPALTLEATIFRPTSENGWGIWQEGVGGNVVHDPADASDLQIEIVNTEHFITKIYEMNQKITWSISTSFYLVPYTQGLKYTTIGLAKPVAPVTNPDCWAMCVLDDFTLPHKIFFFGMTQYLIETDLGTPEFYQLMHRAVDYMLDNWTGVEETKVKDLTELAAYPNPAIDNLTVRFFSYTPGKAKVSLVSMTGQILETIELDAIPDYNFVSFDANKYAQGVYFIDLEVEGNSSHTKVVIE